MLKVTCGEITDDELKLWLEKDDGSVVVKGRIGGKTEPLVRFGAVGGGVKEEFKMYPIVYSAKMLGLPYGYNGAILVK